MTEPETHQTLRRFWDEDAATYDSWPEHRARSATERAAWASELARLLPTAGTRLLDVGAGTGFLSLAAARLGHDVTALDISQGMLARLQGSADREGLKIETVCAPAERPPSGPYDTVVERLMLWTLPDPAAALRAWRQVTAPGGRLLAFESMWTAAGYGESVRRRARKLMRRGVTPEHHAPYPDDLIQRLPLVREPSPGRFIAEIEAAGWRNPRLARLRDVEFGRLVALPALEQLFGVTPQYVIAAERDDHRDGELSASPRPA